MIKKLLACVIGLTLSTSAVADDVILRRGDVDVVGVRVRVPQRVVGKVGHALAAKVPNGDRPS